MNGKLKIQEIANQTGLSISTVSRVLAGKANTSAKAKQRVMAYAQTQGILQNLSSGRLMLNNIMVFAPHRAFDVRTDIFYYKVIQGITEAVTQYEVMIRYCGLSETQSDISLFLEKMTHPQTEAAIIIGIDDPRIHALAAGVHKPTVLVNCRDKEMSLDSVSPDHQLIGEFSANYLIQQGHRKILTLQCLRRNTMELRLVGIKEAFASHNMNFDDNQHLITTHGFGAEEAEQAIMDFMTTREDKSLWPTAILAGGDYMAVGAVNALNKLKISVPDSMSVMSMDGFNLAEIHDVPLTAVHVPRDELGAEAIQLLQRRLLRPDAPFSNILLQGRLVARSSVKQINHKRAISTANKPSGQLYD
ncbi:LacI family transcriptional regulator [Yersinia massiliensis]|jgi:DNA-binding LacI/PurR family transcriptional regulator|uniref:LacI-family regulatory protein n=2 Tax=Yersinia TaxID=629 RepID=A0AAI9ENG7_YERFR|nr:MULTISPECIES: LacI family DNA-binding transcriptional regulator [Yersinia]HEC1648384.1 LacI family DNA-binding transcriptional regulator [Yersinia enterocolitica]MDA5549931.1 LacI family DNA-binding transcriptional regulator [Yersinia massiliensis]MDN0128517.1 LacI family DNA-binding transcriptional regulator [Yersinia massiliensis]NIL28202.1 LacI family transcriptional regulator [Yersinia massiliensis]PHZ22925.1 LacI family transcriptional regulator [Yersinia massiliensis]